jgi:hypothetical protein
MELSNLFCRTDKSWSNLSRRPTLGSIRAPLLVTITHQLYMADSSTFIGIEYMSEVGNRGIIICKNLCDRNRMLQR